MEPFSILYYSFLFLFNHLIAADASALFAVTTVTTSPDAIPTLGNFADISVLLHFVILLDTIWCPAWLTLTYSAGLVGLDPNPEPYIVSAIPDLPVDKVADVITTLFKTVNGLISLGLGTFSKGSVFTTLI